MQIKDVLKGIDHLLSIQLKQIISHSFINMDGYTPTMIKNTKKNKQKCYSYFRNNALLTVFYATLYNLLHQQIKSIRKRIWINQFFLFVKLPVMRNILLIIIEKDVNLKSYHV